MLLVLLGLCLCPTAPACPALEVGEGYVYGGCVRRSRGRAQSGWGSPEYSNHPLFVVAGWLQTRQAVFGACTCVVEPNWLLSERCCRERGVV